MRMGGEVDEPFRSDGVEFIKEQDTRFGRDGSLKYVPYLYTVISSFLHKMEGRTHTDFSLAPMYLFSNSGPLTLMKFRPHSFATAEASNVFPQPGYP